MMFFRVVVWSVLGAAISAPLLAADKSAATSETPASAAVLTQSLSKADFDDASLAEWIEGEQRQYAEKSERGEPIVLANFVWAKDNVPGRGSLRHNGIRFGEGKKPGLRHLRVGFKSPQAVGTIVIAGAGRVSVLKPGAKYPGDLGDESQWIPAERLEKRSLTGAAGKANHFALWILPPNTKTQAIRISHEADVTEKIYAGNIAGAIVLASRVVNLAPLAVATASGNEARQALINNESVDGLWGAWDNWEEKNPPAPVATTPAWVMLTWAQPVTLRGLATTWTGFGAAEVQSYVGPANVHPKQARDDHWQTVAKFDKLEALYPFNLGLQWLDFGKTVKARAVRLRITGVAKEGHPHLNNRTEGGRRVWLGDLMALAPLDGAEVASVIPAEEEGEAKPPIAVRFHLKQAGLVTLVLDDPNDIRVRNLVSETWFPAGDNIVWWDGQDDLGRDAESAKHGIYHVPGKFVAPGAYKLRGIWGPQLDLRYEFPVYTEGKPAWQTADHTGGWLSNHSAPRAALFVPGSKAPSGKPLVLLGSYVSEGTHGLAWVDLDGRKVGGVNWVGGNWTGAPLLAGDDGKAAVGGVHGYVGAVWEGDKAKHIAELRLTALTSAGDRAVIKHRYELTANVHKLNQAVEHDLEGEMGGFAARNGLLFFGLRRQNQILVVDARQTSSKSPSNQPAGAVLGKIDIADPRGLAFDSRGDLLILSGKSLARLSIGKDGFDPNKIGKPTQLAIAGLDDPQQIAMSAKDQLLVADWGKSHQVKIFDASLKLVRTLGKPGGPQIGRYDAERMHHPYGMTVEERGRVWVAEHDEQPKRVSVWTAEGKLDRAFYGPMEYGGGGVLDPRDKTRFYYRGMEFALDWKAGSSQLKSIYYRQTPDGLKLPERAGMPVTPFYRGQSQYFSNSDHSNPVGGAATAMLWRMNGEVATPCGAIGRASNWELLKADSMAPRWPKPENDRTPFWKAPAIFLWIDENSDGQVQPIEVTLEKGNVGGITLMPDLSWVVSRIDQKAVRFAPLSFSKEGVPRYDLAQSEILVDEVRPPKSSGGDQTLVDPSGWTVLTLGAGPLDPHSISGFFRGQPRWSYPSLWPGLHASHEAPIPDRSGQLIGTTRLLGGLFQPKQSDAGPMFIINGNMGAMYLFTADGLLVRTLFQDFRLGRSWSMPTSERGMLLNAVTSEGENFWPSVTQTIDGQVYIVDGARGSLVRVDHLEQLRRIPDQTITLTESELKAAQAWHTAREVARQQRQGQEVLEVAIRREAPKVDGLLDDWSSAKFATVDKRGVKAWFNSNSKPYDVTAAAAIADGKMFAAFRCGEKDVLNNSGENPTAPFKTGGGIDIMLGADPKADPNRTAPVAGDLRLLISMVPKSTDKNKRERRPLAVLYRAVAPGAAEQDRTPFASPWRTVYFDRVEDVSDQVTFAMADDNFEFSIPLSVLHFAPRAGDTVRGDFGILRGNGFQTMQRAYWNNKATGIVNDVPSEAMLTPRLWGRWNIVQQGAAGTDQKKAAEPAKPAN